LATTNQDEPRLALFIDFENIAIGVRDAHYRKFDVNLVLERLLDKGKLIVKKAYADWSRYSDYKRSFHEAAIELIEVPQKSVGGKNSADIRLVVDAMDMSFQKEHINCFVVASGDSDFSPLVSKLKENDKYVIGLGVKNSTSDLLIENCDEFIFYEDLVRGQQRPLPQFANVPAKVQECFALLVDSIVALQRENKEILWGSMVKETMKRKRPQFNETYFGFRTFSHLLEEAQRQGIVKLRRDQRSGSYIVDDLGAGTGVPQRAEPPPPPPAPHPAPAPRPAEAQAPRAGEPAGAPAAAAPGEATNGARGSRRRRPRRRGRGEASPLAAGAFAEAGGSEGPDDADLEGEDTGLHDEAGAPEESGETGSAASGSPSGEPATASAPAERAAPRSEPERAPFSFFSWIRREPAPAPEEPADEPAAEPAPKTERGE